jgi:hypothetical protein
MRQHLKWSHCASAADGTSESGFFGSDRYRDHRIQLSSFRAVFDLATYIERTLSGVTSDLSPID